LSPSTPAIVPRWEWRAFGPRFPSAEAWLAGQPPTQPKESDEIYFLSAAGDNVKIRDDLMDIKVLRKVGPDGLEQWEPVMKASFPLPAAEVAKVLAALALEPRSPQRASYTIAEFTADFAGPGTPIRAVQVHKQRHRFTIGKCMGEISDVIADGRSTRTVAVESEDPSAVVESVRHLGLSGWVNTGYPSGLLALASDELPRFAVIDVGTNSVKLHVGEYGRDGKWRTIVDRADLTRLGEGLEQSGEISAAARDRTTAAIAGMVQEARKLGARAIAGVGTAGLRIARNSPDVLAAFRKGAGVDIEVIPGDDEARLAYLAVQAGLPLGQGSIVVFDTGGGSSQFTFGQGSRVDERFSVDVGALRYTERFGLASAVTPDVLRALRSAISADLYRLDARTAPDTLVGMGGAVTNLAAVKHGLATYDPNVIQGATVEFAEIDRQIELYRTRDAAARRAIVGLQPKRAEVILGGACIVRTIMEKLGQETFTVSDRALRHGVLTERFGG
jgi:exopolyphosphatase/guanosine-5'-triphosphate,3'-diphosphate pyrophosphatase